MASTNDPPPGKTFLAAAAGGFGGAILGVVAATALMGDADTDGDSQAAAETPAAEIAVAEN